MTEDNPEPAAEGLDRLWKSPGGRGISPDELRRMIESMDRARIVPVPEAKPAVVYVPPADGKLIAEIGRLHAVIGRLREAWAVTVGELDQMAEDVKAMTDEDVKAMDARFIAIFTRYEGAK